MNSFILLKDFPGIKAGAQFYPDSDKPGMYFTPGSDSRLSFTFMLKFPDFFREVVPLQMVFTAKDLIYAMKIGCDSMHGFSHKRAITALEKHFPQHADQFKCL